MMWGISEQGRVAVGGGEVKYVIVVSVIALFSSTFLKVIFSCTFLEIQSYIYAGIL